MEIDNQNPNAQGTGTADPSNDNGAGAPGEPNGIQKRINELTGKFKTLEETSAAQLAAKDAQIAELLHAVTARQAPAVQAQDPADDLDPEERRKFERLLAPLTSRFEATIQRLERQAGVQAVQSVAAEVGDPRVAARAQQLMDAWIRTGRQGWEPRDAVIYATGEIADQDRRAGKTNRDERGRFNSAGSGNLTGGSSLPNMNTNTDLPANFESLSPDKQLELLEKRLDGKKF